MDKDLLKRHFGFILLLTFASVLLFLLTGKTAYEWPTIDMGPFFERFYNRSFLVNDFFTNASYVSNPRHIFGHLVLVIAHVTQNNWYSAIYLVKVVLVLLLPAGYYLVLYLLSMLYVKKPKRKELVALLSFLAVLVVLVKPVSMLISVAWWEPIVFTANPLTPAKSSISKENCDKYSVTVS